MNPCLQPGLLFGEIVGQLAQQVGVDGNARPLHIGQHHDQRPFQRLIDGALARLGQLGPQQHVKAQGDVGVLGGITCRLLHRHAVEADLLPALAGDFAEGDGRVGQMQLAELVHAVAVQAAFQHIGDKHRVVDGVQAYAALQKDGRVILQVLADLEDSIIFEQGLQARDHIGLGHLLDLAAPIKRQAVAPAMTAGDITGLARRNRQRHAAQARLHRIERSGFGIDADDACRVRPGDPLVQVGRHCDGCIGVVVDGLADRIFQRRDCGHQGFRQFDLKVRRDGQAGVGSDGIQILDLEMRRRTFGDGGKFHRLEEGDQLFRFRLAHREAAGLFA